MSVKKKILLSIISGVVFTGVSFYVMLPAINPLSPGFWIYLAAVIASFAYPFIFKGAAASSAKTGKYKNTARGMEFVIKKDTVRPLPLILIAFPVVITILGSIISSEIFNARAYANIISVEDAVFAEDMKETNEVTNIALMDGESAKTIGNRTLGSLSEVVSQYEIGETYTQINYKRTPQKVANLEYADFFKWLNNRGSGIPGFVMVDPVNNTAEYIKLDSHMKYVDSGYLGDDLMRKLRFDYPTKIFDFVSFEINEEGKPFFIVTCIKPQIFPFGGMDAVEAIIFDPCTGESEIYPISEIPAWVDAVYSGDLAEQKYNWHGTLSGGFLNSIIGNKDCKQTTDDYGYIVIEDDVWYFTGVTSVTSDESNIGFIISNARTGEYKYYPVVGAEEYSAMSAAEGEVQEKGYDASFPSLINVDGQATYIMVLKDAGGLVKLYALVNVEQYGIVATGNTQAEAMRNYKELLVQNGIVEKEETDESIVDTVEATVTVTEIKTYTVDGNTVFYIKGDDGKYYKGYLKALEKLIFVSEGAQYTVVCTETEDASIREIVDILKADNE